MCVVLDSHAGSLGVTTEGICDWLHSLIPALPRGLQNVIRLATQAADSPPGAGEIKEVLDIFRPGDIEEGYILQWTPT